jgi:hypothetical protein
VSAAKQKGTAWETALVNFLKSKGIEARRVAQTGMLDTGDIHGISPFIGQAKNYQNLADGLRLGVEGAEVQKVRAGEPYGVALVKRARKPVSKGYAVMTVETFADLLVRLRRAEDQSRDIETTGLVDRL